MARQRFGWVAACVGTALLIGAGSAGEGVVWVEPSERVLRIRGDEAGNAVVVRVGLQWNDLVVEGLGSTRVEGTPSVSFARGSGSVAIDLREGDNEVLVTGGDTAHGFTVASQLAVRAGAGNDLVVLDHGVAVDLLIDLGSGADTLIASDVGCPRVARLHMRDGDDLIYLGRSGFGFNGNRQRFDLGRGNDRLVSTFSAMSWLSRIRFGTGDDEAGFAVGSHSPMPGYLHGGDGNDRIRSSYPLDEGTRILFVEAVEDASWDEARELLTSWSAYERAQELIDDEGSGGAL